MYLIIHVCHNAWGSSVCSLHIARGTLICFTLSVPSTSTKMGCCTQTRHLRHSPLLFFYPLSLFFVWVFYFILFFLGKNRCPLLSTELALLFGCLKYALILNSIVFFCIWCIAWIFIFGSVLSCCAPLKVKAK